MRSIGDTGRLVHRPGSHHTRVQLDLTKRAFVAGHVLLQDGRQRFGLLRTQVNSLKIIDLHLGLALLLKVPNTRKKSQTFTRTCTLLA